MEPVLVLNQQVANSKLGWGMPARARALRSGLYIGEDSVYRQNLIAYSNSVELNASPGLSRAQELQR